KTRLFVTQGKQNGLTRGKLVDFINDKCSIASGKLRDIQILDKFSFVTLPFHEAETVLSHFIKRKRGPGPFITKAKKHRK
ncbi:MAG: DbpA RNA binding domain-containing protein, partial [Candidatus Mariimomonas ferrooxydans]